MIQSLSSGEETISCMLRDEHGNPEKLVSMDEDGSFDVQLDGYELPQEISVDKNMERVTLDFE
jgi:hypothetical protein